MVNIDYWLKEYRLCYHEFKPSHHTILSLLINAQNNNCGFSNKRIWFCKRSCAISIAGKYIAASQRPDGTWRKARRVKDGYVPQEEVPLYESKGKQYMKKPDIPVGMCPIIAQQAKLKRDKQKQQQQQAVKVPGLINLPSTSITNGSIPNAKKDSKSATPKQSTNTNTSGSTSSKKASNKSKTNDAKQKATTATMAASTKAVCDAVANLNLSNEQDLAKQLKKLRKKIRDIESIEERLRSGELKNPEKDQLDKVSRKKQILEELHELEKFEVVE